MTLIVGWVGVDTHGTSSAYISSDSRVSWGSGIKFDSCRKIFNSKKFPEIIGYCGDVLFPSLIINSIIDLIDSGVLFSPIDDAKTRFEKFKQAFLYSFANYPSQTKVFSGSIEIIYINKDHLQAGYPKFYCYTISCKPRKKPETNEVCIPEKSGLLVAKGSGKAEFSKNIQEKFSNTRNSNTSRNIFHCFSYTLQRISDRCCGGPPQLAGIYRKPHDVGRAFGVIYNQRRYLYGIPIFGDINDVQIEWRNTRFERCDGNSKVIFRGAQQQPILISDS